MTTPPDRPGEPENPWAPPAGPARRSPDQNDALYGPVDPDPFGAYSGPAPQYPQLGDGPRPMLDVAPQRSSRAGLLIGAGLLVLVVAIGAVLLWVVRKDDLEFGSGTAPATTTVPTTTTSKPKPFAVVGDCVLLTGGTFDAAYAKTECTENKHNYVVTRTLQTAEKCGEDDDSYVKYTKGYGMNVCLVPVFADGECYDFALASLKAEFPKKPCGGYMVVKAKVLADTVDKAACGQDERLALALAYPEIKTTYCLTHTFTIG
ncbi:hypothetical protein [Lentzea sp. HUAS12]|uniref:LppU/SCO3897 family protein n=1 Tax=Lentzea sp. HUAS12 TaxID=2951806 RepID=UPI00209FE1BC|nr:hypothetical protein [Lentzea sp. HUAS12]USX52401.1 hypothetical protein ND450_45035 [Lentzea sp. HUAS12]